MTARHNPAVGFTTVLVSFAAILLAVVVVRNAAVMALRAVQPAEAAKFWSGHPSVELSRGLMEIGQAARERRAVDERTFAMIDDAAAKAPLAAEPFLVRGVQAQLTGKSSVAKRAFLAAQWRDPRSLPAAYFLSDYYLRRGDALDGLRQAALLARLAPRGAYTIAPMVAAYARERSNWPQIRALFQSEEWLEEGVLTALATDPRNLEAILALAGPQHRRPDSDWLRVILYEMVEASDYRRARALWASMNGSSDTGELPYDPTFSKAAAPPPFNWQLTSSSTGVAERQPGGSLHVIFYGSKDGVLARQLLLLPAATYRFQMQLSGAATNAEALSWSIRCDRAGKPIARATLDRAAGAGFTFEVPANCAAQWLELTAISGDVAEDAEATITSVRIKRSVPDA